MKKIEKITLKELEVIEVGGEYETRYVNEKTYPAFLTNYSLKKGKELGYIDTSLFSEMAKLKFVTDATDAEGNVNVEAMAAFDEDKVLKVIYLALLGPNPKLLNEISYDDFLESYHEGLQESLELYGSLIGNLVSSDPNQFAKEFEKATAKSKKK